MVETFDEVCAHLAENGVQLDRTPLALGPWLRIAAEGERFVENPAADALLTREYRKPFVVPGPNEL